MKQIAIVTGASSGMGMEFIRQIAEKYDNIDEIWAIARRKDKLFNLSKDIATELQRAESKLICMSLDLLDSNQRESIKVALEENKPKVVLLVNAAGIGFSGNFEELDISEVIDMAELNCVALTALTHICLPYMHEGARIIQFASAAAFMPQPGFAVYAATKAYVLSFSRALRRECRNHKITVTAVCPGPVMTEFIKIANKQGAMSPYKRLVMAEPKKVVAKAVRDSKRGKSTSVYGLHMKVSAVLAKVLPHDLLIRFFG